MRVSFFRVATADQRRTLAIAAVCLTQRYCGVLWRGSGLVREERDLDAWAAAARELLRTAPPSPNGPVARLILDPSLHPLGLRTFLVETTHVHRRTRPADWEELLRGRMPTDGAPFDSDSTVFDSVTAP
jgi:hypothetical protein